MFCNELRAYVGLTRKMGPHSFRRRVKMRMIVQRAAIPLLLAFARISFAAPNGHEKMVSLLSDAEFMSIDDNHYQGASEARRLRSELASLADGASAHKRVELNFHLGIAEGFLGNERTAIKHLDEAVGLQADVRGAPRDFSNQVRFRLAVAYLRLGETENCCLRYTPASCVLPIRGEGIHTLQDGSLRAIEQLEQVLSDADNPSKIYFQARWLLNIAYMTVGRWPNGLSADLVVSPEALRSQESFPHFTNLAPQLGLNTFSLSGGVVADDFDNDDDIDLLAPRLGVAMPKQSFPAWFWDFDNDGNLDLMVWSYAAGIAEVAASYLKLPFRMEMPRLYRGDGAGGFTDVAASRNVQRPTKPMGVNFGDIDNDGYLDFYLGTGDTDYTQLMPNLLYVSRDGGGRFADVTEVSGLGNLQKGHGIAFADFDNDGDQDFFEQMGGAYKGDAFGDAFYENPGFGNRWLTVHLEGVTSNRSAIGARIRADVINADGSRHTYYKHVNSGGSFGANPLRQTIGLGRAQRIEQLEILWPSTSATQVFRDVRLDSFVSIVEGQQSLGPDFADIQLQRELTRPPRT